MGIFDFLFKRNQTPQPLTNERPSFGEGPIRLGRTPETYPTHPTPYNTHPTIDENELALQRYRYMLRTAPPETIEQAHAEAFARMTPEQRAYVLQALANELPEAERATVQGGPSDPHTLARVATRAELRNPGAVERVLSQAPAGGGMGAFAGSLLMSFAAGFAGSMVAMAFFEAMGDPFAAAPAPEPLPVETDSEGDFGYSFDDSGDFGGGDWG